MPLISVSYDDPFHYFGELIAPEEWFLCGSIYEITEAEAQEFTRLHNEYKKFQKLLEDFQSRPKVEDCNVFPLQPEYRTFEEFEADCKKHGYGVDRLVNAIYNQKGDNVYQYQFRDPIVSVREL